MNLVVAPEFLSLLMIFFEIGELFPEDSETIQNHLAVIFSSRCVIEIIYV